MTIPIPSEAESKAPPQALFPRFRLWAVLNLGVAAVYLLPLSWSGERFVLLAGLGVFWVGVVAALWPFRWLRLLPITVALLSFYPVRTGTTRLLLLCGLMALWIAAVIIFRQRRSVLATLITTTGLAAGFMLLPGRAPDPLALRAEYVRSLQGFQGTPYIWGGENGLGIDCSGLIRCGWIDANLRVGLRTLNPGLLRQAARIWWQDCSAKELGEGYRDRTRLKLTTPALNRLAYDRMQSGDVAVTQSGAHTMAYLGDRLWIEADPLAGAVITVHSPAAKNPWFEEPMKIVRWRAEESVTTWVKTRWLAPISMQIFLHTD